MWLRVPRAQERIARRPSLGDSRKRPAVWREHAARWRRVCSAVRSRARSPGSVVAASDGQGELTVGGAGSSINLRRRSGSASLPRLRLLGAAWSGLVDWDATREETQGRGLQGPASALDILPSSQLPNAQAALPPRQTLPSPAAGCTPVGSSGVRSLHTARCALIHCARIARASLARACHPLVHALAGSWAPRSQPAACSRPGSSLRHPGARLSRGGSRWTPRSSPSCNGASAGAPSRHFSRPWTRTVTRTTLLWTAT